MFTVLIIISIIGIVISLFMQPINIELLLSSAAFLAFFVKIDKMDKKIKELSEEIESAKKLNK